MSEQKYLEKIPCKDVKLLPTYQQEHIIVLTSRRPDEKENVYGSKPKFCSKCENLIGQGRVGNNTIHSILAYRRCRCHRQFRYRKIQTVEINKEDVYINHRKDKNVAIKQVFKKANEYRGKVDISPKSAKPKVKASLLPPISLQATSLISPTGTNTAPANLTSTIASPSAEPNLPPIPSCSQVSRMQLHAAPLPTQVAKNKSHITELAHLVKFIDQSKRKYLKNLFKDTDKNGDGHATCTEFLGSLPKYTPSKVNLLKKFYEVLNEATFFGCREFSLCHSIAERMIDSSTHADVTIKFLKQVVSPFMVSLAEHPTSGYVTLKMIQDCATDLNHKMCDLPVSIAVTHLPQVSDEGQCHILDCLARAPFFLVAMRSIT